MAAAAHLTSSLQLRLVTQDGAVHVPAEPPTTPATRTPSPRPSGPRPTPWRGPSAATCSTRASSPRRAKVTWLSGRATTTTARSSASPSAPVRSGPPRGAAPRGRGLHRPVLQLSPARHRVGAPRHRPRHRGPAQPLEPTDSGDRTDGAGGRRSGDERLVVPVSLEQRGVHLLSGVVCSQGHLLSGVGDLGGPAGELSSELGRPRAGRRVGDRIEPIDGVDVSGGRGHEHL